MDLYNLFLSINHIPNRIQFENILSKLPPIINLETGFEHVFDSLDDVARYLFNFGVFKGSNVWADKVNLEQKTLEISGFNDLDEFLAVDELLSKYGWKILDHYNILKDYTNEKVQSTIETLLKITTVNNIKEILEKYD